MEGVKKSRQNTKRVIFSANKKKQKECANGLNDLKHQNESFQIANIWQKNKYNWVKLSERSIGSSDCRRGRD